MWCRSKVRVEGIILPVQLSMKTNNGMGHTEEQEKYNRVCKSGYVKPK